MALVRWEPVRELGTLQTEVNRLFSSLFDTPTGSAGPASPAASRRWIPAMDLFETDDHLVLRADLPGLDASDVTLEVENGVLTVAGERAEQHETKRDGFLRVERASGSFRRSLTLPEGVDPDGIAASFDKGVLEVRIPKPAERKPRRVEISVGAGAQRPAIEGTETA